MTKKLVLGNHLVPEILQHLGKLAPLPSEGLLAGQALCSAILDLYAGGGGVYNDIDIFLPASEEKLAQLASEEYLREEALRLGLPRAQLDEYNALTLSDANGVVIAGCEQEGLINYVWCNTTEGELLPGRLVYGFDLNAVEVALDLEHKELTWSRAFEEFLQNRELEVTSLATPERTLLRYFKKRQELVGVYGKDELVKSMVATWLTNACVPARTLTTKSLFLAKQFEMTLGSHFQLDDKSLVVNEHWKGDAGLEEQFAEAYNDMVDSDGLVRLMPTSWYAHNRATAHERQQFAQDLVQFFDDRNDCDDGSWENVIHMSATVLGGEYLQGMYSLTHRDTVLRVLMKHENLNGAIQGLTLDEQYRCMLDLAKRAKQTAGPLVYGYVEANATPIDMWNQQHRDQFFRQMGREGKGGELNEPYFSNYEEGGWTIRELRTASALRAEGLIMNHCVGGYARAVRSGRSRILSIRHAHNPKWYSTVELRGKFAADEFLTVSQHYSYGNTPPAKQTEEVLKAYLELQRQTLGFKLGKEEKDVPFDWMDEPLQAA